MRPLRPAFAAPNRVATVRRITLLHAAAPLTRDSAESIDRLFEAHGGAVYRRALRLLGDAHDAEEATQEIFIRMLRGQGAFERRSQLTTWLYQITTHYCLNMLRDAARRRALRREHLPTTQDAAVEARASDIALARTLLARADAQQAQAAVYVFIDGMSHEEAAGLLGVSKRTVGNLLERFRAWARSASELELEVPVRRSGS